MFKELITTSNYQEKNKVKEIIDELKEILKDQCILCEASGHKTIECPIIKKLDQYLRL